MCGVLLGWSFYYSNGSLIEIRPGLNTGFRYRTFVSLALGGADVASLGISDSVRGG